VPGASPRRGKQYKKFKKRQHLFTVFFEFFANDSQKP